MLSLEAFYRNFANRREVAAYSGLAPIPWKTGGIDIEQGISKAGNARLRKTMIQLAWWWLRHQSGSDLSRWFINGLVIGAAKSGASSLSPLRRSSWSHSGVI